MTEWITQLLANLGYFELALLTFLENVFPPIPSEAILPLGGYLVAQGKLTFGGVVLAGTIGSVLGALVLYALGTILHRDRTTRFVARYGGWFLLTTDDVDSAFGWFEKYGFFAVFLCRLIPGVRSLISIPAGASRMPLVPFLLYSIVGTALWSALLAGAGMALGAQYEDIAGFIKILTYGVVLFLGVSVLLWIIKKKRPARGVEVSENS